MDDETLESLRAAFEATPDNEKLLHVLLGAYLDRDECAIGAECLRGKRPGSFDDFSLVLLAGKVWLRAGDASLALAFAKSVTESDESLILQARAYLELEERELGVAAYQAAVGTNAAMEDVDLATALNAKSREVDTGRGPQRLRVISNDDTADTELTRILNPEAEAAKFADVGGLTAVKKQIHKRIILPFEKPSLFKKFRKKVGGGILLYGPPGCGKTLLARATAGECDAHFFNIAISDILDMYIGESEQKLHAIFEKARSSTPAVIFFDEIEAIGGKRQYTRESTSSKLVSQFLAEMDGFSQDNSGVLILGATNVPWAVDPAFRRPGRFDRVLFVPPPDREAREAILGLHLAERPCAGPLDLAFIAKRSSGFSGADLQNIVETAADEAIDASIEADEERRISDVELRTALSEVRPTTKEWLTTARNYARYANESGQYDEVLDFLKRNAKE